MRHGRSDATYSSAQRHPQSGLDSSVKQRNKLAASKWFQALTLARARFVFRVQIELSLVFSLALVRTSCQVRRNVQASAPSHSRDGIGGEKQARLGAIEPVSQGVHFLFYIQTIASSYRSPSKAFHSYGARGDLRNNTGDGHLASDYGPRSLGR